MSSRKILARLVLLYGSLSAVTVVAQQTVTTPGGSGNQIAKFSASSTVVNSAVTESNGNVGIGTTSPQSTLDVAGIIRSQGQEFLFGTVPGTPGPTGSSLGSSGGWSSFYNGAFFNSNGTATGGAGGSQINTAVPSWRMALGSGTLEWPGGDSFALGRVAPGSNYSAPLVFFTVNNNGATTISNNGSGIDFGQAAFVPDNADVVSSFDAQAGPQTHFRLSRAYCDKRTGTLQSSSDQTNFFCVPDAVTIDDTHPPSSTPNKDFLIAPYKYGMAMEYPSVLEIYTTDVGIHPNHRLCSGSGGYINSGSCQAAGHLWAEDNSDYGGMFATAYDVIINGSLDRSQSFVLIASDTYPHSSHGDMLFAVRDPNDNFRFQFGASGAGGADDPTTFKNFTKARIDSTGKGFFDGGTQTGGADFAESVDVIGTKTEYEPGDVLVINPESDRRFALSSEPYSTLVAGVYSTKPGTLATRHKSEDSKLASEIPMAIVGIVPCKVSAENGPISRGDLLVTSSTPGYAMRATDKDRLSGAIVGKALQSLPGGKGQIEILMTLR